MDKTKQSKHVKVMKNTSGHYPNELIAIYIEGTMKPNYLNQIQRRNNSI